DKAGVDANDQLKYQIVERVRDHLDAFSDHRLNSLDGLRLDFENSSILIRASGTEPKIRVIVESEDQGELERLMGIGKQVVNIAKREVP
ncbi:MAG: hypothetical protein IMF19_06720, partial [Proteobacteria bacterium]|nr:hypothetical protein [Pseudomonadota bacterium]